MADNHEGFVDISSSTAVSKVYGTPQHSTPTPPKKNKNGVKLALRIVALCLSVLLMIGGLFIVFGFNLLNQIKRSDIEDVQSPTTPGATEKTVTVAHGGGSLLEDDDVLNILLFGQDYKPEGAEHGRSDTMILMSLDNTNKKIKLTSFQRDTYVSIPGWHDNKINAAFTFGGEALAIDTIETNFGIKVDKYATVDFKSFRKIIEVLGGVDMELNLEEIEYINAQIDVNNQLGKTQFLEYDPTKELQTLHLDGYQALWYARDRGESQLGGNPNYSFSGDDWDRTERQRKLLETIVKYLRTKASLTDLIAIINEIGPLITTNLSNDDILFLASNIMTYINYDMVQFSTPPEGTWRYGRTDDGQSVIVIDDWDTALYKLASFIYENSVVVQPTEAASKKSN